jgi:thymidine phosphorylase
MGARASALVTDMSQPLGRACGNALEVREAIEVLRGGGPADVRELTLELAAEMLRLAGTAAAECRETARRALDDGRAWDRFVDLVAAQGGDVSAVDDPARLPRAPVVAPVVAARGGTLSAVDTFALGELLVRIGAGRRRKEDPVDPAVGVVVLRRLGERVGAGEAIAELHLAAETPWALARASSCFTLGEGAAAPALLIERIESD